MAALEMKMVGDREALAELLAAGEEQTRQLEASLGEQPPELCRAMARSIRIILAEAIAAAIEAPDGGSGELPGSASAAVAAEKLTSRKRKTTLPRWRNQVRVGGAGERRLVSALVDDGFSWRKYGQKDILGAKYPRAYYRCTYRNTMGCQATKHLQKSDSDPSLIDVSYRGEHTCSRLRGRKNQPHQDPRPSSCWPPNSEVKAEGAGFFFDEAAVTGIPCSSESNFCFQAMRSFWEEGGNGDALDVETASAPECSELTDIISATTTSAAEDMDFMFELDPFDAQSFL